ncbi:MAG TPA: hypothetical protein PKO09_05170 [Anaerolineae bacterium]|nr:hypothetical protein [Anaerolineae bacterium]
MSARRSVCFGLLASVVAFSVLAAGAYAGLRAAPDSEAVVPSMVSYQGVVSVDSSPFEGVGSFKFAIVDSEGAITFWSNDGTSSGGAEPATGADLVVSQGQFDVLLGDTSIPHMTEPLIPAVFAGAERYLRLWFSSDGVTYEHLTPDRRIAAVPWALQAQEADTLDGLDASELLLPGGAMVLGATAEDPGLIGAGFSYTGATVQPVEWFSRRSMPTGRERFAMAGLSGVVYAMGGWWEQAPVLSVAAYDPATDTWSSRASMPGAQHYSSAAAVADGKIYAMGGCCPTWDVVAYDPATDTWATRTHMPGPIQNLAAAEAGGIIYTVGGLAFDVVLEYVFAYDPVADSWSQAPSMSTARHSLAAAAVGGLIYAIGGLDEGGASLDLVEAYDPSAGTWASRAPMPARLYNHAAAVLDGKIYVLGGIDQGMPASSVLIYDPATDAWTSRPNMPTRRTQPAAAVAGDVIYVVAGTGTPAMISEAFAPQSTLFVFVRE